MSKIEQHSEIEERLRSIADGSKTLSSEDAKSLAEDSIEFIEEQLELMTELVARLDSERSQREFYGQVLVAISKYRGSDITATPIMALAAVAEGLPKEQKI